ncbi:MAG: AraC family transcriptional regulator [Angelakisella sp.]
MEPYIDRQNDPTDRYIHFYNLERERDMFIVQMGHHYTPRGFFCVPTVRDHYVIHFIKSGKGWFEYRNRRYDLTAGHCFLIEPSQIASYQSDLHDPWEYYWIGFNGYMAADFVSQMGFSYNNPVRDIIADKEIFAQFGMADEADYDKKDFLLYHSVLYYILYQMVGTRPTIPGRIEGGNFSYVDAAKTSNEEYVQKVIDIIKSSYSNQIKVMEIADRLSLNRSYLSRIFKEQTGMAIKEYLIDYRLNQARALLHKHNKTVTDVAQETGFNDPLYFSRLFKEKYGLPPTEFRASIV